jgi:hypothetical protein
VSALGYVAIAGAIVAPELVARYTQLPPCKTIVGAAAADAIRMAGGTPTCDPDKPVTNNTDPVSDFLHQTVSVLLPSGNPFIQSALGTSKQILEEPVVLAAVVVAVAAAGFIAYKAVTK